MNKPTNASQWRIDLATELSAVYSNQPGVKVIVIGGSPSRGISDESSDIDMIVYWDSFDNEFLDSAPLSSIAGQPQSIMDHRAEGSMMELYYIDTLNFEVGHISLAYWEETVDAVMNKHIVNPMLQKTLGGFLDSHVIYGMELAESLKEQIRVYPEELARAALQRSLGFYWKGCIEHQGLRRGEIVFFYDAITQTVKRLLAIVSALNKRYFAMYEPRWIEYELSHMPEKPDRLWERIQELYESDRYEAVENLEILKDEIVGMVRSKYPDLDYRMFDDSEALRVRLTPEKPSIK